ncbi:hypothetical protein BC829DRAFT_93539 [Chytridium lagenaria]|nr:hypothetical protein BC829DRAFT_93539 [Chytridium lagenaria]
MSVTCGHSDDVDYVELRQLQTEVKLNVSDGIGDCAQAFLLAISNIYGYIVYGTSDGFGFALTKDVREVISNAPKQAYEDFTRGYEVSIPEGVYQLRISADELHVLASTGDGEIRLYDAISLLERKASFVTIHTSSPEQAFVDVQANPEAYPETFAALRGDGRGSFWQIRRNSSSLRS